MSLQAASVVSALLMECQRLGIDIVYDTRIRTLEWDTKFMIRTELKTYYGNQLVIATGGKSYSDSGSSGDGYLLAKAFGHSIQKQYPSIVQLKTNDPNQKALKGLKYHVQASLFIGENRVRVEDGEVLFTDYGLSGPVILQLSTEVEPHLSMGKSLFLTLDFFANMTEEALDKFLMERLHRLSYRTIVDCLNGFLNQRLIIPILKRADIALDKKAGNVAKTERTALVKALKAYKEPVTDTYLWNQAQVTKGGVNCKEIFAESLESRLKENLYFVGEVLDIDGDCGGYNLQWAISSGAVAAKHIHTK
jgi:predicted Rossmann fold flavoprotein